MVQDLFDQGTVYEIRPASPFQCHMLFGLVGPPWEIVQIVHLDLGLLITDCEF